MKVQVIRPNVEKFRIRFERSDPDYFKCTWADILIDYDRYAITAQTDCGDYSYRWPITPGESFQKLCLRMLGDEEYLLEKFSDRREFRLDESKLLFEDYHTRAVTFVRILKNIVLPEMRKEQEGA